MSNTKAKTIYAETAIIITRNDNVCRVSINGNLEWVHATKLFVKGKSLA